LWSAFQRRWPCACGCSARFLYAPNSLERARQVSAPLCQGGQCRIEREKNTFMPVANVTHRHKFFHIIHRNSITLLSDPRREPVCHVHYLLWCTVMKTGNRKPCARFTQGTTAHPCSNRRDFTCRHVEGEINAVAADWIHSTRR